MTEHRTPSLFVSLIPLLIMALFLSVGYGVYHIRAEVLLISAAMLSGLLAVRLGYTWKELETGIVDAIRQAMPAMLIVICVGVLIGSWIAAGTIPMLIYYGLQLISPVYYLVTAALVCSIVSLLTGTSWGTVGTLGIALMGIAQGLGLPLAPAAGAIVTGAYFGDKLSPFSDTTNLAPIAARSNLYDHIKHMLWTTLPAWSLGLAIYFFYGLSISTSDTSAMNMQNILDRLTATTHFSLVLLLPPCVVLYFAVAKKPVIPGMLASSFLAAALAWMYQGMPLPQVLNVMATGYVSQSGEEVVDKLLSRGGMMSMMDVTLIALCAFAFSGIVRSTGMLQVILHHLLKRTRSTGSLIARVVASCVAVALMTGSSFLTILIPGELYAPAFKSRGLAAKNLSRTTEDSGTVVVPLIPWSMAGVYMSGTLGVPVIDYVPWAFMCYLGVFFALFYGYSGLGIAALKRDDETLPGS